MTPTKTTTRALDGHFLMADIHEYPSGKRQLDVVYLDASANRKVILTERFASRELLYDAFVEGSLAKDLGERARTLVPEVGVREQENLAAMADLNFVARDVRCDCCGARPGETCFGSPERCDEWRVEGLRHFLIWLAEQRHRKTQRLTKKLIVDVAQMLGYCTAENLYYRDHGVVLTSWSGRGWRLYVGGRLDPTKSVWMTSHADLSNPERGPFRDAREIALAMRAVGRGE